MKTVNSSNTKAQILKAYQEAVAQLRAHQEDNAALKKELAQKQKTVEKATTITQADAPKDIRGLRRQFIQQMDELEAALEAEQSKLADLQAAIGIEEENLEEVYQIKREAASLDALVSTNRQAREKLEAELRDRKAKLEAEIEETRKAWKREEEEYAYELQLKRRREADEYAAKRAAQEKEWQDKKAAFEQEMATREQKVAEQESELAQLRTQAEAFEQRLQTSVEQTEATVKERLTREFEYQQQLQVKDLEAQIKLDAQQIDNLKTKVREMQQLIDTMSGRAENATQQVKDIALKAIEHSQLRPTYFGSERKREEKGEE